jgi:hypothetical protein
MLTAAIATAVVVLIVGGALKLLRAAIGLAFLAVAIGWAAQEIRTADPDKPPATNRLIERLGTEGERLGRGVSDHINDRP